MNAQQYRIETDFLGDRHLPQDALYGIQSLRGAESSDISDRKLGHEPALIEAMAQIKMASAETNQILGVISNNQSQAIICACEEMIHGAHHDALIVDMLDGSGATAINMNMNEVIANLGRRLPGMDALHPNDHVNISQSTNDVVPSAIKLAAYRMTEPLLANLNTLSRALKERSDCFADVLHLGRTCLQDAQPMTLGQVFSGYAALVKRQQEKIAIIRKDLLTLPLGGTAIGTGLGTPPAYTATLFDHLKRITGLPVSVAENPFDAMQNADTFARFSAELKVAALAISKIAQDLIILSSGPVGGFGELKLPPVLAGSSIMPGKVNPTLPQMMCQVGFAVAGNDTCISMASQQGQLEINAYEPVIASRLFDSLRLLSRSCAIFATNCIQSIEADVTRNENNLFNSSAISTAFVKQLGYNKTAELVRQSHHEQRPFAALAIDEGLIKQEEYAAIVRRSVSNAGDYMTDDG
jgi:aspartate ammonia-lyase